MKPLPQAALFDAVKPVRVTVPVTPEVLAEFQRLAAVSGVSVGRAMGDWLGDTMDGVRSMRELLEKAREAPRQVASQLNAYALGLSDLTATLLDDVQRASKGFQGPQKGRKGDAAGRAPSGPSGAPGAASVPLHPPLGNTGGKVHQTSTKVPIRKPGGGKPSGRGVA